MEECEWCEGKKDCPAFEPANGSRPGYACTRSRGHEGKHVACLPSAIVLPIGRRPLVRSFTTIPIMTNIDQAIRNR